MDAEKRFKDQIKQYKEEIDAQEAERRIKVKVIEEELKE